MGARYDRHAQDVTADWSTCGYHAPGRGTLCIAMGDPARKIDAPPLSEAERIAYYDRHLRELGADPARLSEETDATLEDTLAWLRGEAPCPVRE